MTGPAAGSAGGAVEAFEPVDAVDVRPSGWYGLLLGLVAVGAVLGSIVYAYYYLAVTVDDWPPPGVDPPAMGRTGAAVVLAVAAAAAARVARRVVGGPSAGRTSLALAATAVLGAAFVAVDAVDLAALDVGIDDHAYGAVFVTLRAYQLVAGAVGAVMAAVCWSRFLYGPRDAAIAAALRVATLYWIYAAATIAVVWAVLHLTPRAW